MLEDYNQEFENYIARLEESLRRTENQIAVNDEKIANRPSDNEVGEREVGGDYVSSEIIQNSHLYDVSDEIKNDIENAKKIQKEVEDKFNIIEEYNKKIEEYKTEKEKAPTQYLKDDYANLIEGCKKYQQEVLDEINKMVPESIMNELQNKKEDQTEIANEVEEEKDDNKSVENPSESSADDSSEDNDDSSDNEEVDEEEEEKDNKVSDDSSSADSGDSSNSEDEKAKEETPEEEKARLEAEYEKVNKEIQEEEEKISRMDNNEAENNNENEDEVENENDNTPNEQEERREIRTTEEILNRMEKIVPVSEKSDKKYKARNIKLGKEFHKDLKEGVFGFNVLTAGVSLVKNTVKKLSGWVRSSWVDLDDAVDIQAMIWMLPPEEFKQVINDLHGEKGDDLRERYSHTLIDRFEQTYREYLTEKPEMFEDDEMPYDDEYDTEEYDNEYDNEYDEEVQIRPDQPENDSDLEDMMNEINNNIDDMDDIELSGGRRL